MDASVGFLVLFLIALGLTVVSFALGMANLSFHGIGHLHAHVDLAHGHGGGHPGLADAPHAGVHDVSEGASPFNLATLLAFFTWFGGAGYLLTGHFSVGVLLSLFLAALVGLAGAALVFLFLTRVLIPGQTPYLNEADYELAGTIGRLSVGIRPGGTGELVYSQAGTRRVMSARSAHGEALPRGAEVVIVRDEGGIAYVETFKELLESEQAPSRQV